MNKEELIKLRESLKTAKTELYRYVMVGEKNDRGINIEHDDGETKSKLELMSSYSNENEQKFIDYIESSLERIVRVAAQRGLDYSQIKMSIGCFNYISEEMAKKIVEEEYRRYIPNENFDRNQILSNLQEIYVWFNSDCEEDVESMLDKRTLGGTFLVDYNKLVPMLEQRGYSPSAKNANELLDLLFKNEMCDIVVDFTKENYRAM